MEHKTAQRRILVCAAFVCFGSLCGATTFYRISHLSAGQISDLVAAPFAHHPMLMLPLAILLGPILMLMFGHCPLGTVFISCILLLSGFFIGFLEFLAIIVGFIPIFTSAFFVICSACYVQIGGSVLRLYLKHKRKVLCSGLSRPDFSYDYRRIFSALSILLFLSLAYSLFILSM